MADLSPKDYLDMANGQLRALNAVRDDLLAVLFPHGDAIPSELLQTKVKLKLLALVDGIERNLTEKSYASPQSWDVLVQSGLLRETALVDFALARIAEDKLRRNIYLTDDGGMLQQLPTLLLGHENQRLADMARLLLNADQRATHEDSLLYRQLGNEHLHLLCWRIVAVLQQRALLADDTLVAKAQSVLSQHDEMKNAAPCARKLVFFLGAEYRNRLNNPRKAGLSLFIASMMQDYGLEGDFVYRLLGEASPLPLLLMLKGKNVLPEDVADIVSSLRGAKINDAEFNLHDIYDQIDPVDARTTIVGWSEDEDGGLQ